MAILEILYCLVARNISHRLNFRKRLESALHDKNVTLLGAGIKIDVDINFVFDAGKCRIEEYRCKHCCANDEQCHRHHKNCRERNNGISPKIDEAGLYDPACVGEHSHAPIFARRRQFGKLPESLLGRIA